MMNFGYFPGKGVLKTLRWQMRRFMAGSKYGFDTLRNSPRIFGNAMPKSGSHLLTQVLGGLTNLGPFVDPGFPPVNRTENNQPLMPNLVEKNIRKMKPGDIRYGYIHSIQPYLSLLTQPTYATIFLYRDPRDMLVSHIFYAADMYEDHGMHHYYNEKLTSMEERINAAIIGVKELGYELASVSQRYQSYQWWLEQDTVLCLKFEELVLDLEPTLNRLLDFLEERGADTGIQNRGAIEILKGHINPKKSGTFRKGKTGSWREHFTDENKEVFKEGAGDLLLKLGYEQDHNW